MKIRHPTKDEWIYLCADLVTIGIGFYLLNRAYNGLVELVYLIAPELTAQNQLIFVGIFAMIVWLFLIAIGFALVMHSKNFSTARKTWKSEERIKELLKEVIHTEKEREKRKKNA